jgi:hypothetical protein
MCADNGPFGKTYRRFMFASWQPSQGATTFNSADQIKAGRIEVHIKEVIITGRRKLH